MTLDDVGVLRRLLVLTTVLWLSLAAVASAADVNVDRFDDPAGAGACTAAANDCSLRQAIAFATWGDTLTLGNGSFSVERGTLLVDKNLTFAGTNRLTSVIDGFNNGQNRIMRVLGVTVALTDLSFVNGSGSDATNPPINATGGGALFNDGGSVIMQRVRFSGNSFVPNGGAVYNVGALSIQDADFDSNSASFGAAIFTGGNATVTIDRVSLRNGGGTQGGGLFNNGSPVTMTNSTVADNGRSSTRGGGIVNHAGSLTLRNVTLVGNLRGGLETDGSASTTVQNTILGASPYQDGQASACVSPGLSSAAGGTAAQPITTSLGNNLSEDTICNLNGPGDQIDGNAHLAPAASNGGNPYSWTAALLHGSSAIDGANDAACSPLDGRANQRAGLGLHCDIGAFEATMIAAPAITSTSSHEVTATHATLSSDFDMKGESGTLRFVYGQNPNALINTTQTVATGVGQQLVQSIELDGLEPTTTYYFAAVVDNATGSATGPTQQFMTSASSNPPQVLSINVDAVTDTTAALRFQIDPQGQETTYVIEGGAAETPPVTIPATAGIQEYTRVLTGLTPATTYTVQVLATNASGSSGPDGATADLTTVRRATGDAGQEITVVDNGTNTGDACPAIAHVNWGDGTPVQDFDAAYITCADIGGNNVSYETRVRHTYEAAGRFHVTFAYDTGDAGEAYAVIAETIPDPTVTPTATATPAETATPAPVVVAQVTPTPTPTGPKPVFHQTVVVAPAGGTVLVKRKGTSKFVPLGTGQSVPLGSQIDVTKGKITLTSVPTAGGVAETADFYGGIFTVTQVGDVTVLRLSGPEPTCKKAGASAGKKVKKRSLWGDGKGKFRTEGKYAAATVRGTRWYVEDNCTGTLTKVAVGLVSVRDNVAKKTLTLRAGKQYLAKPKKKR